MHKVLNMNLKGFQCFKKTCVFRRKDLSLCPPLGQNLIWLFPIHGQFVNGNKLPLIPLSLHLNTKRPESPKSWSCCGWVQVTQPAWCHVCSGPHLLICNPESGAQYDTYWNNNQALLLLGILRCCEYERWRVVRRSMCSSVLVPLWRTPMKAWELSLRAAAPRLERLIPDGRREHANAWKRSRTWALVSGVRLRKLAVLPSVTVC